METAIDRTVSIWLHVRQRSVLLASTHLTVLHALDRNTKCRVTSFLAFQISDNSDVEIQHPVERRNLTPMKAL